MKRPQVVPLHAEPPAPPPTTPPGYLGLRWTAERTPATRRWAVVGRTPGRPHGLAAVIEVRLRPGHTTAESMARVTALVLNELAEDVGSLIAATHFAPEQEPT